MISLKARPLRLPGESEQDSRHAPSVPAGIPHSVNGIEFRRDALSSHAQRCVR